LLLNVAQDCKQFFGNTYTIENLYEILHMEWKDYRAGSLTTVSGQLQSTSYVLWEYKMSDGTGVALNEFRFAYLQ
jgi:hypothetical protein